MTSSANCETGSYHYFVYANIYLYDLLVIKNNLEVKPLYICVLSDLKENIAK